jgi:hypothetical protein
MLIVIMFAGILGGNLASPGHWKRARRTILVSDTVSFITALLLYYFAGRVRTHGTMTPVQPRPDAMSVPTRAVSNSAQGSGTHPAPRLLCS